MSVNLCSANASYRAWKWLLAPKLERGTSLAPHIFSNTRQYLFQYFKTLRMHVTLG